MSLSEENRLCSLYAFIFLKILPLSCFFGWHFNSYETGWTTKVLDLESGNDSELNENQESKLKSKTRGLFIWGEGISVMKPGNHSKIKIETSKQTHVDEGTVN